ncbi:acetyl-CoA synthetase [Methylobacterium sp. 174MFSha1.1]|uniref:acetate--CoA ligase family protein n=1 Tax=Methylobacterium sp. 174MFSha1.1 TaxID=1502749 RepID=UPI0008F2714E|nr:acetate--CoA ligase family protein [Methylobacterium sp. 174MFSha1.1]SFU48633.1 acetyl-CoA synthetase [Methylobacterium sp. 174MFSha1.1]
MTAGESARRDPYAPEAMARLVAPRSVAVVGVSERPNAFGSRTVANLKAFDGRLYQISARHTELAGRPCYPSVAALPETPDCVVIATPREAVEPVVRECASMGVGAVLVLAAGFAETGKPENVALQQRLVGIARDADMRLVGPNTIGLVNYATGAGLTFSAMPERRPLAPHAIGIVSQSGSLGFSLGQGIERGVSVSHVLTAGNSCDVDVADHVGYLAQDPHCRAIACLFEGMADPGRMLRAAALAWEADKPLVLYKIATGQEGARAALSHTGSLAGSDQAYAAGFSRAGVIQVDRLEALVEAAAFFAKAGRPRARGVAVIATSGGATIIAADKAEAYGIALPQPGPEAASVLAAQVPEYGSTRNPCDVTAQVIGSADSLAACAGALLADPLYGVMVTSHAYAYESATVRLPVFSRAAAAHDKLVCNVWAPEWLGGPGARETESDPHLALFHSMDRCFATIKAWHRRDALRQAGRTGEGRIADPAAKARMEALLGETAGSSLTEREAKAVMALYGIPVVEDRPVASAAEARRAARALGFPVVLKGESPDILHKTEAGLVKLGLGSDAEVERAYAEILAAAEAIAPKPDFRGVVVQPMIPRGVEVMVGARHDPQFGPLVVVGLGGVLVEILRDTALSLAPVGREEAEAMLRGLKGAALLDGFRGAPAVEVPRLAEIVSRFSELAADAGGAVAEMEINPLICARDRIVAADALIVKGGSGR